jgi:hypothetical protein
MNKEGVMPVKRYLLFPIVLLAIAFGAFAADYSAYGFTTTGTRTMDNLTYDVLVDGNGNEVLLSASESLNPERATALKSLSDSLFSSGALKVASIRATNDPAELRLTVLPKSLVVENQELLPGLPGGLVFWYDKTFEYDFRVKSGAYAIRIQGLLSNLDDLFGSVALAYKDPVAWLLQRDPSYAIKRITELTLRETKLEEALAATKQDLATAGESQAASLADLQAKFEATKAESEKASASTISRLETALMTALNVGFFSGPKPIKPESVAWVLAKKAENPAVTKAELIAAAKAEKFAISDKEIGIVLQVKFGES